MLLLLRPRGRAQRGCGHVYFVGKGIRERVGENEKESELEGIEKNASSINHFSLLFFSSFLSFPLFSTMDACANDAEIAAALAAVEEADAATLARAEGSAPAAPATSTGGIVVAASETAAATDDADSSAGAAAAAAAPNAPLPFERPSDEAIVAQENAIRAQVAGSAALVGKKEPLSALEQEYSNDGAAVFAAKARALGKRYGSLRRARGDGNCFFRSFMFALAESLLERRDLAERNW